MQRRFFGALALLGLMVHPAFGADVSAQAGAWVVGPIAAESGPSNFCSMKNSFKNGHLLVIARDTGGGDSIAVDFGRKTIEAGHQYPLTLAAGKTAREVTGVGATPRVMLINMAGDSEFSDALAAADALHLKALNKDYAYSMAGASDALPALQECVDALASHIKTPALASHKKPQSRPAAVAKTAAKPPVVAQASKKETHADDAELKVRAEAEARLAAENRKLAAENEKLKQTLAAAQDKVDREKDLKQQALASLQQENARLQQKLAAPPKPDGILAAARLVPPSAQASRANGEVNYRWQDNDLFVSAEEVKAASFDRGVSAYFDRMAGRCKGDFAHVADKLQAARGLTIQKAEMACIDDKDDAAASLLFVGGKGSFAVIAREGTKDQMEAAIAARNASAEAVLERN